MEDRPHHSSNKKGRSEVREFFASVRSKGKGKSSAKTLSDATRRMVGFMVNFGVDTVPPCEAALSCVALIDDSRPSP